MGILFKLRIYSVNSYLFHMKSRKIKHIVIILTLICSLLAGFNVSRPASVSAASYSVPKPTNLQASIWGMANGNAAVTIEWGNSTAGLNYLVTKINPDGTILQFVLQSTITDPSCMMQGGFFQDPLVEKGKTYTYKVKAFDGGLNYSAEVSISVTINIGDSIGCRGRTSASASSSLTNLALNIDLNNPDGNNYDIYVDGKLKKTTNRDTLTIWPVFGPKHEIKVVEATGASNPKSLVAETATACEKSPTDESVSVDKSYSGFYGNTFKLIDYLLSRI